MNPNQRLKALIAFDYKENRVGITRFFIPPGHAFTEVQRMKIYHYTFSSMIRLFKLSDRCKMVNARRGLFAWFTNRRLQPNEKRVKAAKARAMFAYLSTLSKGK